MSTITLFSNAHNSAYLLTEIEGVLTTEDSVPLITDSTPSVAGGDGNSGEGSSGTDHIRHYPGYLRCGKTGITNCGRMNEWFSDIMYSEGDYVYDFTTRQFFLWNGAEIGQSPQTHPHRWRVISEHSTHNVLQGDENGEITLYLTRGDVTIVPIWNN